MKSESTNNMHNIWVCNTKVTKALRNIKDYHIIMNIYRRINDMKVKSTTSMAVAIRPRPILQAASVVLLLAISFALLVAQQSESGWVKQIRYGFIETFSPVVELLSSPAQYMEDSSARVKEALAVYQENKLLKQENTNLLQWQTVAAQLENENKELRQLLGLNAAEGAYYITARVVSDMHDPLSHTLFIRTAETGQLQAGLPVLSAQGIVGHVLEAKGKNAKVLLITDRMSRLPVQSETTGSRAVLAGTNQLGIMELHHVENIEEFTIGDRIVTTASELFPVRMAIGEISAIDGQTIKVRPLADTTRLRYVSVAVPEKAE